MPSSNRSGTSSVDGSSLSGCSRLEQLGPGGEHAAVRPEELVGRAGEEVGAERLDVDRRVRREVHAVDVEQRAGGVRQAAIARTSGIVPIRLDAAVTATSRVRSPSSGVDAATVELGGLGVEVDPAHGGAGRSAAITQGRTLRVVVEPGHHDLVARAPVLGQGPGEVDRSAGSSLRPNTMPPRVGAEQVGHRGAAAGTASLGVALGRRHVAAVGQRTGEHVVDRLRHHVGRLRAARAVEVGGPGPAPRAAAGSGCAPAPRRTPSRSRPHSGAPASVERGRALSGLGGDQVEGEPRGSIAKMPRSGEPCATVNGR